MVPPASARIGSCAGCALARFTGAAPANTTDSTKAAGSGRTIWWTSSARLWSVTSTASFEHQPPAGAAPGVCPLHCDDQARELAISTPRRRVRPCACAGAVRLRPSTARADAARRARAARTTGAMPVPSEVASASEPVADSLEAIDRREGPPRRGRPGSGGAPAAGTSAPGAGGGGRAPLVRIGTTVISKIARPAASPGRGCAVCGTAGTNPVRGRRPYDRAVAAGARRAPETVTERPTAPEGSVLGTVLVIALMVAALATPVAATRRPLRRGRQRRAQALAHRWGRCPTAPVRRSASSHQAERSTRPLPRVRRAHAALRAGTEVARVCARPVDQPTVIVSGWARLHGLENARV